MKQLYKSNTDKMLFGVCGGLAEFFGISSTLVRLIFVILAITGSSGIFIYIVAAILMPSSNIYKN